ncbi:hypothetical protein SRHO_G00192290 [Serrasalmus rhombeus]
MMTMVQMGS